MRYSMLDEDELLRLALDAIQSGANAEVLELLKNLLAREPDHVHATYLLAAEHARLGMLDRAEAGFRRTTELAPDLGMARFQLGQVLAMLERVPEALEQFDQLANREAGTLGLYSRGLSAALRSQFDDAVSVLDTALALPQDNPGLQQDMQSYRDGLVGQIGLPSSATPTTTPIFMSAYGRPDR